jgi:large subunit ribosomal protein L29
MRADEIRDMTATDIHTKIHELEEEQFRLHFRAGTETLDDPLRLRVIRRDIARLKTVLREQAGAAAKSGAVATGAAKRGTSDQQQTTTPARKTAGSARR